jgi:hypothetical protein
VPNETKIPSDDGIPPQTGNPRITPVVLATIVSVDPYSTSLLGKKEESVEDEVPVFSTWH